MVGIPTLKAEAESLRTLRDEHWFFTLARLTSDPHGAPYLPAYIAFGSSWDAIAQQEQTLRDALTMTHAAVVAADDLLNDLSDQVSAAIHDGKKPDLSLPLHVLYFGSESSSEAKRGLLGPQLVLMSSWPDKLVKATKPALLALVGPVTAAVAAAHTAEDNEKKAQDNNAQFRLDGDRVKLFKGYNALASSTYGSLRAFAQNHPELKLRSDWPESFFRHEPKDDKPTTIEQADKVVEKLEADLGAAIKHRDMLVKEEEEAKIASEEQAKADAAHAAAKKATEEAKKAEKDAKKAAEEAKKNAKKKK
jgi:hypothetical protein